MNDVFEDGDHYQVELMDFIRTDGTLSHKKPTKLKLKLPDPGKPDISNNVTEQIDVEDILKMTPNEKKVIEFITQNEGQFHKDIANGLNIDKTNLSKVLKSLEDRDLIEQGNEGGYYMVQWVW
jgi:predicted HTH transcriptional regulator